MNIKGEKAKTLKALNKLVNAIGEHGVAAALHLQVTMQAIMAFTVARVETDFKVLSQANGDFDLFESFFKMVKKTRASNVNKLIWHIAQTTPITVANVKGAWIFGIDETKASGEASKTISPAFRGMSYTKAENPNPKAPRVLSADTMVVDIETLLNKYVGKLITQTGRDDTLKSMEILARALCKSHGL